jgi:hypothetical protein
VLEKSFSGLAQVKLEVDLQLIATQTLLTGFSGVFSFLPNLIFCARVILYVFVRVFLYIFVLAEFFQI